MAAEVEPEQLHETSGSLSLRESFFVADILLTANRTTVNDTEVEQDLGEREEKMREVEAMLREMRNRSSAGQRGVAEREKAEAEKRKDPNPR